MANVLSWIPDTYKNLLVSFYPFAALTFGPGRVKEVAGLSVDEVQLGVLVC